MIVVVLMMTIVVVTRMIVTKLAIMNINMITIAIMIMVIMIKRIKNTNRLVQKVHITEKLSCTELLPENQGSKKSSQREPREQNSSQNPHKASSSTPSNA